MTRITLVVVTLAGGSPQRGWGAISHRKGLAVAQRLRRSAVTTLRLLHADAPEAI
jgi:hypothetical protein